LADITLQIQFKIDGVLTDVAGVVLADPAGAFGAKRTDTDATVVAANTGMTRASVGLYRYTFTAPAAGLTYNWWAKVTDTDGAVYHIERTYLDEVPTAGLPSYLTLAQAEGLAAGMALKAWASKTNTEKSNALAMASLRIDAAMRYQGGRYEPDQSLEFPRIDGSRATTATGWRESPGDDLIIAPNDCLHACILEADSLLLGDRESRLQAIHDGLTAQSIGSGSESYGPADGKSGVPLLTFAANQIMQRYRLVSGRIE
jgi:hypothetical protein